MLFQDAMSVFDYSREYQQANCLAYLEEYSRWSEDDDEEESARLSPQTYASKSLTPSIPVLKGSYFTKSGVLYVTHYWLKVVCSRHHHNYIYMQIQIIVCED